jgi:predicted Zn-dependent peptidase
MAKEAEFYRKKLDSGLTVIFEKRQIPVIAVASSVKFGAQYEAEDIKGISHFIEHLVFKGTKKRTVQEIPQEIESKGGIINAFTAEEITSYWSKLPSKHFELGADITRDLVLNPLFDTVALERERKVILEEIKMYRDNPGTYVLEKIKEMLYEKPFSISITGDVKSVSSLTRKKVTNLFNSIYSTNNMIFSVVGNTSWDKVLAEAAKFPKTKKEINFIPINPKNGKLIEKRKGIDQAHSVIGFHTPRLTDKDRYAAEVFDSILGGGMSSRLFQEIREKRGLCYMIRTDLEQSKDYAYEMIYSGSIKEKVDKIKSLVLKEIKKLKTLNKPDFEEAKERLIGLRQISKEKSETAMTELLAEELGGNAENYYKYEEEISKVKLKEVQKLSNLKGYSFVVLVPE